MQEVNRTWLFERLKRCLQLLACAPEIQPRHFPDFVHVPDELALDFDNFRTACVGNFRSEMTAEQLSCLDSVDQSLEQMKGRFTSDAVMNSREWRDVRLLAADALKAFGWPLEEPPASGDAFIQARPNSE
jgi:hypothetical protein